MRRRGGARRFLGSDEPASKEDERGAMLTLGNSPSCSVVQVLIMC